MAFDEASAVQRAHPLLGCDLAVGRRLGIIDSSDLGGCRFPGPLRLAHGPHSGRREHIPVRLYTVVLTDCDRPGDPGLRPSRRTSSTTNRCLGRLGESRGMATGTGVGSEGLTCADVAPGRPQQMRLPGHGVDAQEVLVEVAQGLDPVNVGREFDPWDMDGVGRPL